MPPNRPPATMRVQYHHAYYTPTIQDGFDCGAQNGWLCEFKRKTPERDAGCCAVVSM
jgi:hypothetical protein